MSEKNLQSQLADGVRRVEALHQLINDGEAKLSAMRAEVVALQHEIDHIEEEIRGEGCSDG